MLLRFVVIVKIVIAVANTLRPVSYTHLFLVSQRKGKGLSGRRKGAFLMDQHPRCGAVLQLADKKQTADCRRNVDRSQSPVGALRSCGFVQVPDQHDSAPGSLCNVSQTCLLYTSVFFLQALTSFLARQGA